ncbi:hypothetical protein [Cucumibacter marinus]|uniref:hypothetical protein n=1 Tax=Cucumibacter marinus TaxID=1121252 RepID=UPI000423AF05|nr:hypothetical protein [Cucumibacter marinus]
MSDDQPTRNRLLPWYLGIAAVLGAEVLLGFQFFGCLCDMPVFAVVIVMLALPAIYLWLMYLTLISQK